MSNFDINVDRRTEKRMPISHPAISRCDKKWDLTFHMNCLYNLGSTISCESFPLDKYEMSKLNFHENILHKRNGISHESMIQIHFLSPPHPPTTHTQKKKKKKDKIKSD